MIHLTCCKDGKSENEKMVGVKVKLSVQYEHENYKVCYARETVYHLHLVVDLGTCPFKTQG